jgi:hypothetical protein
VKNAGSWRKICVQENQNRSVKLNAYEVCVVIVKRVVRWLKASSKAVENQRRKAQSTKKCAAENSRSTSDLIFVSFKMKISKNNFI